MSETDGIEEAAEQLLRTATMTAAQIVEQLARARQQRLRDDASSARDRVRVDARVGRDRDRVQRSTAMAEEAMTGPVSRAWRTAARSVDQILAADTADSIAEHAARRPPGSSWDIADRHAAFEAELSGIADREAVAARLLLDRARAHPPTAVAAPAAGPNRPFLQAPGTPPSMDVGR